jgi:hypothetical protein
MCPLAGSSQTPPPTSCPTAPLRAASERTRAPEASTSAWQRPRRSLVRMRILVLILRCRHTLAKVGIAHTAHTAHRATHYILLALIQSTRTMPHYSHNTNYSHTPSLLAQYKPHTLPLLTHPCHNSHSSPRPYALIRVHLSHATHLSSVHASPMPRTSHPCTPLQCHAPLIRAHLSYATHLSSVHTSPMPQIPTSGKMNAVTGKCVLGATAQCVLGATA